jgi:LysM repeat protein
MRQNGLRSTLIHPGDRLVVPILATESASLASVDSVGTIRRVSYRYTPLAQIALPPYEAADGTIPIRFVADADVVDEDGEVVQRVAPAPPTRVTYTVRSGDSLSTIARRYGVSVSDLRRWNNLRGSLIRTGQRLTIMLRQT